MNVLVIAEHEQDALKPQTLAVVSSALQVSNDVTVCVMQPPSSGVAKKASAITGVTSVLSLENVRFETLVAEDAVTCLFEFAGDYDAILAPASTFGKNILPRLSAKLDVQCHSDVSEIVDDKTFKHPI